MSRFVSLFIAGLADGFRRFNALPANDPKSRDVL